MSFLRIENVRAGYGAVTALRGISIAVPKGGIVALLGTNGAGKTTTLKCISGMVPLLEGSITFDGENISGLTPNQVVRRGIAHVPEGRKVFRDLTVVENLRMGAYTRNDRAEIEVDVEWVFATFPRLKERYRQPGNSLSGGEQQMLAIGRGLMARPKLLLLDEPSLGLAPLIIRSIFETLQSINERFETTLLLVEQNMKIALKVASYGYVLQVGCIALEGPAEKLRENTDVLETYLGTGSRLQVGAMSASE